MTARQKRRATPVAALYGSTSLTVQAPGWRDLALCAEVDPELFYPETGQPTSDAKRICMACDVRGDCLQYALETNQRFGVWGGLSERQRRALNRRQEAA